MLNVCSATQTDEIISLRLSDKWVLLITNWKVLRGKNGLDCPPPKKKNRLCPSLVDKFISLYMMEQGSLDLSSSEVWTSERRQVTSRIRTPSRINDICDTLLYKTLHFSFITTAWKTAKDPITQQHNVFYYLNLLKSTAQRGTSSLSDCPPLSFVS